MAAIRLLRQGLMRLLMAGRTGRLNMLSSVRGNLAACDGDGPSRMARGVASSTVSRL